MTAADKKGGWRALPFLERPMKKEPGGAFEEAENGLQNRAPLRGGVKGKRVKPQTVTQPDAVALLRSGNTEPYDGAPVDRREPETRGGACADRTIVPGTTTNDTEITGIRAGRVVRCGFGVVALANRAPVHAPLPRVSVHGIQTHGLKAVTKTL